MLFALTVLKHRHVLYCFFLLSFCYAPKDLAPFSYIYPRKNPLLMIKYELSTACRWCFLTGVQLHQQTGKKIGPPMNPATHLCKQSLSLMWYNLFMGVLKVRVKNITVTVTVRVMVRVSLVWFVSSNSLVSLSVAIWWIKPTLS